MIRVRSLTKRFSGARGRETCVFADISFTVKRGERLGVIGPNGVGKSTLLRLIRGIEEPTSGEIRVAGVHIAHAHPKSVPALLNTELLPNLRVITNARKALEQIPTLKDEALRLRSRESLFLIARAFRRFGFEPRLLNRFPNELSAGQRQRATIALTALLARQRIATRVLLLDEPLENIDVGRTTLLKELRTLIVRCDLALVCVSHRSAEISELCTNVLVLEEGRVQQLGTIEEVRRRPLTEFAREFFTS